MSSQEVIFQTNVLIRQIIENIIDGPVNILKLALINRKFYEEVCSRLRQFQHIELYRIKHELGDDDLDETQLEDDADNEKRLESRTQYGINQIICEKQSIFKSNLIFVVNQSRVTSIDFRKLNDCDDIDLNSLLQLSGLQHLTFDPSQRRSSNSTYLKLIEKNIKTLRKLIHPPEDFFKSLLADDAYINLDHLEMDITVIRTMSSGLRHGEDVRMSDVYEEFEEIIENKLKVNSLIFYGHNRARFLPYYQTLLTASGARTLKMICDEPNGNSEDLMFFQQWKNRNHRFAMINEMELIFWKDNLKAQYESAINLLLDVFPKLAKLTFGSQLSNSPDECIEILDIISAYWKKNTLERRRKHYINIAAKIPKEKQNNFENRLLQHKSYRNVRKTCKIWYFTMRINVENEIHISFHLL